MSSQLSDLHKLTKDDVKVGSNTLAKAFYDDPAWMYVFPEEDEREKKLPIAFEIPLRYGIKFGEVYAPSPDLEGVAIWVPGLKADMTFWRLLKAGAVMPGLKLGYKVGKRIGSVFDIVDEKRKVLAKEPYLYLSAIGVRPEHQGKGIGGKLLAAMIKRVDAEGTALYLETMVEKNANFYLKFDFKVIEDLTPESLGLRVWIMIRPPQGVFQD